MLSSPTTGKRDLPVVRASDYTKCKVINSQPLVSTLGLAAQRLELSGSHRPELCARGCTTCSMSGHSDMS